MEGIDPTESRIVEVNVTKKDQERPHSPQDIQIGKPAAGLGLLGGFCLRIQKNPLLCFDIKIDLDKGMITYIFLVYKFAFWVPACKKPPKRVCYLQE